ncbi:hypothetical protein [Azorhizobium sp. AG788]|uniref:hypothetical protein n=1 Tax=Azorhizobium sp. AG788 TaxID=2183897 RepID=UPI00313967B1
MMAFDLHAALLLLLAFALGGAVAYLLKRRGEQRKMSYLAQATWLSLEDEADEAPARSVPAAASGTTGPSPGPGVPAPLADTAPAPENVPPTGAPSPAPPADPVEAPPPRVVRPRRATGAKATAERARTQVPQEMIPLAPADPELPLGLPEATGKPKRTRARPAPAPEAPVELAPTPSEAGPAPASPAAAPSAAGRPPPLLAAPEGMADDLKRLKGIGPQNERRLNTLGIYHLRQIAAWSPEEVHWVGATLAFPGRIEREQWVAQAKALLDGAAPEG